MTGSRQSLSVSWAGNMAFENLKKQEERFTNGNPLQDEIL
jgi:hypothetical protein